MNVNETVSSGRHLEQSLSTAALALMVALPIANFAGREFFGRGVSGALPLIQHLTFCVTFLGAVLAAGSGQLISLSTPSLLPQKLRSITHTLTSAIGAAISVWLAYASLDVVRIQRGIVAWGIPFTVIVAVMPLGFIALAIRLWWTASPHWKGRAFALAGILVAIALAIAATAFGVGSRTILVPALGILAFATLLGLPVFAALGGTSLLLFWSDGLGVSSVPLNTYNLSKAELLPALPLFALAGYILAEGGAGKRLMRAFDAILGWLPGGLAIVVTLVLAIFTTLGSGITILSLGGLILPAMLKAGYSEKSSIGLVTVGGSTGLLFFPSLPVILYGITAGPDKTPIDKLFIGGLIPGMLLVLVVAGWGAFRGHREGALTRSFVPGEVLPALWAAKWDLLTPVILLSGFLGGRAFLIEAAALTVAYVLFLECAIHRGLGLKRDIPRIATECAAMVGGFLILLGVSLGFMKYLTLAEVPVAILQWVQSHIASPIVFLLAVNLFLIIVGAVTDIFAAILVLVPLLAPIAPIYGIDPIHFGVIFLTNMELGYLMPPMGENLFLSSIRFKKKLSWIYVSTIPYLILIVAVILVVTYVPALTLAPVRWFR